MGIKWNPLWEIELPLEGVELSGVSLEELNSLTNGQEVPENSSGNFKLFGTILFESLSKAKKFKKLIRQSDIPIQLTQNHRKESGGRRPLRIRR
jgi:hypothetical protein